MGCVSSTEYVVDPRTGQSIKKTTLGGAYPGQRRPQQAPHVPAASEFNGPNGTATAHFISYGGGTALTLVRPNGNSAPAVGPSVVGDAKLPQYIQVTLPPGVAAGQTIHVQAPDGRLNAIIVPPGFGPGSTFTVEFAPDPPATFTASDDPIKKYDNSYPVAQATTSADYHTNNNTNNNNHQDDGFATGFGNSHWQPATAAANPYSANTNTHNYYNNDNRNNNNNNNNTADDDFATGFGNNSYSAYPTATAKPVYSTTPAYPY